jgi:carboxyl-terminal processing protease
MIARNRKKQAASLVGLFLICAVWFCIGRIVRGGQLGPEISLVEQTRHLLLSEYSDEGASTRELTYAAIRGMLRQINDPHAALLTPPTSLRQQDDFSGKSGVIGLYPEKKDGQMVVSVVFPDDPAYEAGLRVGDVILSVDGVVFTEDTTDAEAILLIRGPVGVPAHFVVSRGDETLDFHPVRQERPMVSAEMLPGDIGYLAQYTFATDASQAVRGALQELLAQKPQGLIWDLSSNGGGSMEAAQHILSYFIEDGLLFTGELKAGEQRAFVAVGEALAPDIPLVVLIGERTYSAAETAAAAIAETGRGVLIGSQTYGKATIQNTYALGEDVLLQLTIARWLSPDGQCYQGQGVTPLIVVRDDERTEENDVLQAAVDYLLGK